MTGRHDTANTFLSRYMRLLGTLLCILLASTQAFGQAAATAAAAPHALVISILEGEGELNDVRARTAREPIVQVEDENHKPVAGALVIFAIQGSGQPGATFSGLSSLTVRTGQDGRAVGRGFQLTNFTGSFQIKVTATVGAVAAAEVFIHQTNFNKAKYSRLRKYSQDHPTITVTAIGLAAFAAAASAIALTSQPGATTITAGTGTVGR